MRVFVYGTLKKGFHNHRLLEGCEFIGTRSVSGFTLIDLGAFPGMVASPGEVTGEVYEIDDETLARLDQLESEGSFYKRVKINIDGDDVSTYLYMLPVVKPIFEW